MRGGVLKFLLREILLANHLPYVTEYPALRKMSKVLRTKPPSNTTSIPTVKVILLYNILQSFLQIIHRFISKLLKILLVICAASSPTKSLAGLKR
jgi:hypothetical protein